MLGPCPSIETCDVTATSASALRLGSVVQHSGLQWLCLFAVDRHWISIPSIAATKAPSSPDIETIAEFLRQPTPTQQERAQLRDCVPTGIAAVDVLAPLGRGQSMLLCGPSGSGKSTLACDLVDYALRRNSFSQVIHFSTDSSNNGGKSAILPDDERILEFAAPRSKVDSATAGDATQLASLLNAFEVAQRVRDDGGHALLILDTFGPALAAWDQAVTWSKLESGSSINADMLASHRRDFFANLLERAGSMASGGSLTLLALMDTEAFGAGPGAVEMATLADVGKAYSIDDFAGRRQSELERLRRLLKRGISLTDPLLASLGITPPSGSGQKGAADVGVARELQSLSDGQIILDGAAARAGAFPAVMPGATFSRFGLGSSGRAGASASGSGMPAQSKAEADAEQRPLRHARPKALEAVAAHLRLELALEQEERFRPSSKSKAAGGAAGGTAGGAGDASVDAAHSTRMRSVRAALLQPPGAHLDPGETAAMLLAVCSGALDKLPSNMAAEALRGGSGSPLVQHLRSAASGVLQSLSEESTVSVSTARELDIAVRLFVAMRQAELGGQQSTA